MSVEKIIKQMEPVKKQCPNTECPECLTYGRLQRNPEFKEPYGYPYRPAFIDCPTCKGSGWVYQEK